VLTGAVAPVVADRSLVRFTTTQALLTRVLRAGGLAGRAKVVKPSNRSDLLDLDEFGLLAADPKIGPLLCEVIATRPTRRRRS
jgi:hypothetical protein